MSNLSEKCMLSVLKIRQFQGTKTDRKNTGEFLELKRAKPEAAKLIKRLLSKSATFGIRTVVNKAREEFQKLTFTWLDDGTRMLPSTRYADAMEIMGNYHDLFWEKVEDFIHNHWQTEISAAQGIQGDLFDEEDYPRVYELKDRFEFKWRAWPMANHEDFRTSLQDWEVDEIKATCRKDVEQILEQSKKELASRFIEPLLHLAKKISTTGKFEYTSVENVLQMVRAVETMNLTDSQILREAAKNAHALLTQYVNQEILKKGDAKDIKTQSKLISSALRDEEVEKLKVGIEVNRIVDALQKCGF